MSRVLRLTRIWPALRRIFQEDIIPGEGLVRGPVMDKAGLHLLYVHSCWEPKGEQTKATKPEWMNNVMKD